MSSRPKDPKTARNKNVLVIGCSGSGKTRFWLNRNKNNEKGGQPESGPRKPGGRLFRLLYAYETVIGGG